jgi:uncharacterized membrane protein YkoI
MHNSNFIGALALAVATANVAAAEGKALTAADAKAKALAIHPGKVLEVEKEKRGGQPVYSVEIKSDDGTVHEVTFRIADGSLLNDRSRAGHDEDEDDNGEGEHGHDAGDSK